jgi:hypothetical protein
VSDDQTDPYSLEENYLRTDGRDVCHWCAYRPQEWVWGPYGTRTCDHCDQLAAEGRADEIVEEAAARLTVYGTFRRFKFALDPERWRQHERERIQRWLKVRTTREPI